MSDPYDIHLQDQMAAADRDAEALLLAYAARRGGRPRVTAPDGWLEQNLADLAEKMRDGLTRGCGHLEHPSVIVHAAVWAPGIVSCGRCAPRLLRVRYEDQSRCDRCGGQDVGVHMGMGQFGNVLLSFGVCDDCAQELEREDAADDVNP